MPLSHLPRAVLAAISLSSCISIASAADLGGNAPSEGEDPHEYQETEPYIAPSPFYLMARGSASYLQDTDISAAGSVFGNSYEYGYTAAAGIGVDLEQWLDIALMRAELEISYGNWEIDRHNVSGLACGGCPSLGSTSILTGFASLYYDIGEFYRFKPFIGAGLGLAHVDFSGLGVNATGIVLDDDGTSFAFHATAGLGFEMSDRTTVEIGYRYTSIPNVDLSALDGTPSSTSLDNHAIFAGLRFNL